MFLISGCPKACVLINFFLIKKNNVYGGPFNKYVTAKGCGWVENFFVTKRYEKKEGVGT